MRPKILSPNVLSFVGEIGNVINKTIKVVNIVTRKRSVTIYPGIFIIDHYKISSLLLMIFISSKYYYNSLELTYLKRKIQT